MSFVAINVLTVPPDMGPELERRFAARAGQVETMEGFEAFELLRPLEGTDRYLVYTRWASRAHFEQWTNSPAFGRGHAQASGGAPAASGAELWSFAVAERTTAAQEGDGA